MNPYKNRMRFFQLLLWGITLALVIVIVLPIIQYSLKEESPIAIDLQTSGNLQGFHWIVENQKWQTVESDEVDYIFVNDGEKFNESLMAKINENIFIGEMLFNQFGGDVSKHDFLENLFDTSYTGVIGKTCLDLSNRDDVPEEIIKLYEETKGEKWSYYGEGIVLTDGSKVIVLMEGLDYQDDIAVVVEDKRYPYLGYFEVLEETANMEVAFEIPLTDRGEIKMTSLGVSRKFPAKLSVKSRVFDGIYYTGQFGDITIGVPSNYVSMAGIMQRKGVYDKKSNELLYWKWFYPDMLSLLKNTKEKRSYIMADKGDDNTFHIQGQQIYKETSEGSEPFFMKGINLGAALPGKTFTEFPMAKEVYRGWLEQMATLNINTIRVYTLLPPTFYQALYEFNEDRENPIYLLQEIWPEEYPEDHNYLGEAYNETYRKEIEYAVHAIHGNINIPARQYRAYGIYRYDVSPYLIGYLVGREMEPEEVKATDELNVGYSFAGRYLQTLKGATPTEAWLAESCDYALKIENLFYEDAPLVAIVSWPTLDPVSHESEWSTIYGKDKLYNDSVVVDINNIGINAETVSGFFGAYHIYPNYPDFMNNELSYNGYEDEQGRFRYGGYLEEFMAGHKKYPAVVAEYGISTSQVTAHYSPDGYDHGGLSEDQQADGIIRMTEAIVREGYSGAIVFEWMDEWAKKTWTTEPYMIPYSKNQFWHNVLDPEQNYGLLAVEATEPKMIRENGIAFGQNEAYIYLEIDQREFDSLSSIRIGIDTVKENDLAEEFLLTLGTTSTLYANPGYNWIKGNYKSMPVAYDGYEALIQTVNKENISMLGNVTPERKVNLSRLSYGDFNDPRNSVYYEGETWTVRIPYGLLGIADPSENLVLSDLEKKIPVLRDQIETTPIKTIDFRVNGQEKVYSLNLKTWAEPSYETRMKDGVSKIADYFESIE